MRKQEISAICEGLADELVVNVNLARFVAFFGTGMRSSSIYVRSRAGSGRKRKIGVCLNNRLSDERKCPSELSVRF